MREDHVQEEAKTPSDVPADEGETITRTAREPLTRPVTIEVIAVCVLTLGALLFVIPSCLGQVHNAAPTAETQHVSTGSALGGTVTAGPSTSASQPPAAGVAEPSSLATGEINLSAGMEHGYVLQGAAGEAYLVVDLSAIDAPQGAVRPAMAVALVIDRSGSMSGPKMPNAIMAASSFIASLADGDVVSIFQYDDVVEQLAPPTVVNAMSRQQLMASVSRMFPRGSTNLHGGLQAGVSSLLRPEAERPLRRVVLISDGLANVGPASPLELGTVAAYAATAGVSVTAIGVGLDYDEAVLGSMAARSGGRFYHLQEPSQMAVILESELNALSQTVARNVIVDVVPAAGVQFVNATGADVIERGQRVRLRVGEIQGGGNRPVVVALRLPENGAPVRDAAQVNLSYASPSGEARQASTTVQYGITESQTAVDGSLRPQFALAVEQHRTAAATLQAAEALNSGDADGAANLLEQQALAMEQRAASMPSAQRAALNNQATKVRSQSQRARRARSRPAQRASSLSLHDDALDGLGL